MTSKLPLATVALIIVVAAAIGAWKILATPQTVTPPGSAITTTGQWQHVENLVVGSSNAIHTGPIPTYSGIENIYLMDTGTYTNTNDLGTTTTGRMGVIESTFGSANVPYENTFDIVVAFKVNAPENAAYAAKENGQIELTTSGGFIIGPENSLDANEHIFASLNPGTTSGYVRVNAVWDNGGSGYTLRPGGTLSLSSVKLFCWW